MNLWRVRLAGLGVFCLFLMGGCEISPNAAFPTASAVAARTGAGQSADIATLELGRKIYTTSCTECHVARPIADYSVARWRHYVAIMAPRAGLQPNDRAALEAYVVAARQSLPPGSAPGLP
jgi:mono/diheme cytochrome c family protein